jgi:hypothetical protein
MSTFNDITVNLTTGEISYPSPEGFVLDMDKVYRTAKLFVPHCSDEMAVKHAIHGQIESFRGMVGIRAMGGAGR